MTVARPHADVPLVLLRVGALVGAAAILAPSVAEAGNSVKVEGLR